MKTVCVLLSTYNGEKYLREQIESLLSQIGVKIIIVARDDGSHDDTISILAEYEKKITYFHYLVGENVGPAQSFFMLMQQAPKADYYAFCDQDDVWDKDKLIIAVDMLEKESPVTPNMYYSNLRIVDQNLTFYRFSHEKPHIQKDRYCVLTENMATGCTYVLLEHY